MEHHNNEKKREATGEKHAEALCVSNTISRGIFLRRKFVKDW